MQQSLKNTCKLTGNVKKKIWAVEIPETAKKMIDPSLFTIWGILKQCKNIISIYACTNTQTPNAVAGTPHHKT